MTFARYCFIHILSGLAGSIGFFAVGVRAQSVIVPDGTLGGEGSIVVRSSDFGLPEGQVRIGQGATRGTNLFHSFKDFNVGNREDVLFVSASGIRNIFARVTGSTPSIILGNLGTLPLNVSDTPNLFLLNPNGIIFGPNSNLLVDGAFVSSTANSIRFGGNGTFSASEPASPSPLLTVQPSAFLFNQLPVSNIAFQTRPISTQTGRSNRFTSSQDLVFLGGNIIIDGSEIQASQGYLSLAAVGGIGEVLLTPDLRLTFPRDLARADISLKNQSLLTIQVREKGDVSLYGRSIDINSSNISTGLPSNTSALSSEAVGKITIDAVGDINIKNSRIASSLRSGSIGKTGGINIMANKLSINDATQITSVTSENSVGDSGNIDIWANNITIDGNPSIVQSRFTRILTANQGDGYAGDINIRTRTLELRNGGDINSGARSLTGFAIAGNITIIAEDDITLSGVGKLKLDASDVVSENSSISSDLVLGRGKGGDIHIFARSIISKDGSTIGTRSSGQGDAGDLEIFARDTVRLEGSIETSGGVRTQINNDGVGIAGRIRIESDKLEVLNSAQIASAATTGQANDIKIRSRIINIDGYIDGRPSLITSQNDGLGQAGNIEITADQLLVANGGRVSANARANGIAGDINVYLDRSLKITNNGSITTESFNGLGGDIKIRSNIISLSQNGDIKTSVFNSFGDAGNINLSTNFIVARGDSDILAFAQDGKGGNITIQAIAGLFSDYRSISTNTDPELLDGNNRVDINASGRVSGIITLPELAPLKNNRTDLNVGLIDTNQIISRSCLSRNPKTGKFYITGTGGLPHNPDDPPLSSYTTLPVDSKTAIATEADNLYTLENGQVIIGKACSQGGTP